MSIEQRRHLRVEFSRAIDVNIVAIDGTWTRPCALHDVSEQGAKLTVSGSVQGLHLKEFFLVLSTTGVSYRKCELVWVNGEQIGVRFLGRGRNGASEGRPDPAAAPRQEA